MSSKKIDEVEKILGEPIFIEFSDYVRKIRTNLLIVSFITIFIIFYEVKISPDSTLLGLKFTEFKNEWIMHSFLALNSYLFLHFSVCSIDAFKEWMVRVTGTKVVHVTVGITSIYEGDYPSDPRQSTLYNWWKDEAKKIGNLKEKFESIETKLNEIKTEIQNKGQENIAQQNLNNVVHPIGNINNVLHELKRNIEELKRTLESKRIPISLEKFDNCYKSLLKTQNLRWLVIEFSFPLFFSATSIILLILR